MLFGRFHRRRLCRYVGTVYPLVVACVLIWGEWLVYLYWSVSWIVPEARSTNSLGILLVADPQLIGFKNENHMLGPITRWDSDRFLSRGFSRALAVTKPDIIIFLGDLFDEGIQASDEEIEWTATRFFHIFETSIPKIYISGDNDVGGEAEPVQSRLTTRFSNIFVNSFPTSHAVVDRLSFTEVNLMNGEITNILDSLVTPSINVILSHIPFGMPSYHDPSNLAATVQPHLILSAHDHKAYLHRIPHVGDSPTNSTQLTGVREPQTAFVGGEQPILELQAPTCSYRMGVLDVAYGFIRLEYFPTDEKFAVSFSLLWLGTRFHSLTVYALVLAVGLLCLIVQLGLLLFSRNIVYQRLLKI